MSLNISPIDNRTKHNYQIEKDQAALGISRRWDDNAHNKAKIGDMFGFLHQDLDCIELFQIINILPATCRRDHWRMDGNHKDRQVLVLSSKLDEMSWTAYKSDVGGYKLNYKVHGTKRLRWKYNEVTRGITAFGLRAWEWTM